MTKDEALKEIELAGREGRLPNLKGAWLRQANLKEAWLKKAWLRQANLEGANLEEANLARANLEGANLEKANLIGAYLGEVDFEGANLKGANLAGAHLEGANLKKANLIGANLYKATLEEANFEGARLKGTVLDPENSIPEISDEEITNAGLEIDELEGRPIIRGYRTKISTHVGSHEYTIGEHKAHVFSVCTSMSCHPGIYFASKEWLEEEYTWKPELVRCYAFRDETLHVGDKWRAKRIFVTGDA